MLLTEEEARLEKCPVDPLHYCRASACKMAWRWHLEYGLHYDEIGNPHTYNGPSIYDKCDINLSSTRGYCGLAGKP